MAKEKKDLKTSFFGLNKNQVEEQLREIHSNHKEKIDKIKKQIENVENENSDLKKKIEQFKNELNVEFKKDDYMNYAIGKVEEIIPIINKYVKETVLEIVKNAEEEENILNKKIEEYNHMINGTKEFLNEVLKEESKKNQTSPSIDDMLLEIKDINNEIVIEPSEVNYEDIIADDKISEEINRENTLINKEAPLENDKVISYEKIMDMVKTTEVEFENLINENQIKNVDGDLFTNFLDKEFNEFNLKFNGENVRHEDAQDNSRNNQIKEVNTGIENSTLASKAIAKDIKQIRSKYLVGKIVGQDLFDSKGNIIVAKNTIITDEVFEKVEKEGKLTELIVNMTFPETAV